MPLSWDELVESVGADAAKILADMPGGTWDWLYEKAVQMGLVSNNERGRKLLIGAILIVGGSIQQNLPKSNILARFVAEMLDEARSELGKRIVINAKAIPDEQAGNIVTMTTTMRSYNHPKPPNERFRDRFARFILEPGKKEEKK